MIWQVLRIRVICIWFHSWAQIVEFTKFLYHCFDQKFRKSTLLLNNNYRFHEIFFSLFCKNFVKVPDLLKKSLNCWLHEIFFSEIKFFHFSKDENFSLKEKIRQINYLVISLVKPLLSRNFCEKSVGKNVCNFHTVHFVIFFTKKII